jgi:SynChlorMet cassette radical SAM/SPASM protein ScmF
MRSEAESVRHLFNDRNFQGGLPMNPLNQLYFYLTEGCNCACRHCWLAPGLDVDASRYPVLPVELFEAAIAEAKPLGLSGVKLTGGEPLLHPDIDRLLDIVRREEIGLVIESNGILLTRERVKLIALAKNAFVSISLDGADAQTHEWVRGVSGAFQGATNAVKMLAEAGLRPQVIFSLMRRNAEQVEAVIRLAEELGAASVKFNVIQPMARGEGMHERNETLSIDELMALGRHVDGVLSKRTAMRLHFGYPHAFQSLSRIASGSASGVCGIKGILGVLADGTYALCGVGRTVPELVFGTVGKDALATIWETHPTIVAIREGLPLRMGGICGRCLMKNRCLGSCVAQNYYRSKDIFAPFWFCEMAEEAGLFPASRMSALPEPSAVCANA